MERSAASTHQVPTHLGVSAAFLHGQKKEQEAHDRRPPTWYTGARAAAHALGASTLCQVGSAGAAGPTGTARGLGA
eukprot:scaffold159549_cov17-Tisochrysis_lutea.AAC.3